MRTTAWIAVRPCRTFALFGSWLRRATNMHGFHSYSDHACVHCQLKEYQMTKSYIDEDLPRPRMVSATRQSGCYLDSVLDLRSDPVEVSSRPEPPASSALKAARDYRVTQWRVAAKVRCFDLLGSAVGIFLLAPVMVLLAIVVTLTSKGLPIYGSPRVGQDGSEFRAFKFRSMHTDADRRLMTLLETDPTAADQYAKHRKLTDDPRVTPVGAYLRKWSLDELPQLFNILKGQMSIVGPRPKLLNERELYGDALGQILSVKPGLTGLWQVSGRNWLSVDQRVLLDLEYVSARSLRGDLRICAKTIAQLRDPWKHGAW